MIRKATHDDIPRIVEMAQRFYDSTSYARLAPMSKESAAGLAIIAMRDGVLLVAEEGECLVGMVVLVITGSLFNVSLQVAEEIAWWIEPEARGGMLAARMLKAAEAACKEMGADVIRMAAMSDSPPAASALYEKRGMSHSDSHYMRAF